METSARLQLALQQLDRLMAFFPRVEGKASFLFAINLGLVGVSAAVVSWKSAQGEILIAILLGLVGLLCGLSLLFLYFAYSPHLAPAQRASFHYFRDINAMNTAQFVQGWSALTPEEMLDDVLHQISRNAEILTKKFNATETAFTFTAFAVVAWLALFALSAVERQSFSLGS